MITHIIPSLIFVKRHCRLGMRTCKAIIIRWRLYLVKLIRISRFSWYDYLDMSWILLTMYIVSFMSVQCHICLVNDQSHGYWSCDHDTITSHIIIVSTSEGNLATCIQYIKALQLIILSLFSDNYCILCMYQPRAAVPENLVDYPNEILVLHVEFI